MLHRFRNTAELFLMVLFCLCRSTCSTTSQNPLTATTSHLKCNLTRSIKTRKLTQKRKLVLSRPVISHHGTSRIYQFKSNVLNSSRRPDCWSNRESAAVQRQKENVRCENLRPMAQIRVNEYGHFGVPPSDRLLGGSGIFAQGTR